MCIYWYIYCIHSDTTIMMIEAEAKQIGLNKNESGNIQLSLKGIIYWYYYMLIGKLREILPKQNAVHSNIVFYYTCIANHWLLGPAQSDHIIAVNKHWQHVGNLNNIAVGISVTPPSITAYRREYVYIWRHSVTKPTGGLKFLS